MLENEARLFLDADSDAMPHFKQTMFPLVNLAHQPPRSSILFGRAHRVPTGRTSAAGWQTCSRRLSNNQIF